MDGDRSHVWSLGLAFVLLLAVGPALRATGVVPTTITGHDDSMTKYESLRENVARDGPDDVVVIGPSVVRRGIVPGVVSDTIAEQLESDWKPRVYNFGVPGHNVLTYPFLVDLVTGVDRPRLFVLHVAPRGIDPNVPHLARWAGIVLDSPYGRASEDAYRLRGRISRWQLDHWFLRTYAPTLRARLLFEDTGEPRERGTYDPARGYLPAEDRVPTPANVEHQRSVVQSWSTDERYERAIDRAVARARAVGAEVLLVDLPMHSALMELMSDPERNLGGTRAFLDAAAERLGVSVAHPPRHLIPDEEFADMTHYRQEGAERYSRWLGEAIAPRFPDLAHPR